MDHGSKWCVHGIPWIALTWIMVLNGVCMAFRGSNENQIRIIFFYGLWKQNRTISRKNIAYLGAIMNIVYIDA